MKLRVLKKTIYVAPSAQKGWKKESINKTIDIIQMWDEKEGWVNLPVVRENSNIYKDEFTVEAY